MGGAYVGVAVAIPLAVLLGLSTERMFMVDTLAEFVAQLARDPGAEPEAMLAAALRDPSLRVCYATTGHSYVDSTGVQLGDIPADRAVTWVKRAREPVAAVVYSADLADQERFVQAAGAAALIRLENAQAQADLKASTADLVASRIRLVEAADAERRRLERDLHDGVQQQLVGLRLKLALAAEKLNEDSPLEAPRALAWIGRQMDEVLGELRALARGIYPALLAQQGLREAIKAAARNSPIPVEVRVSGIDRYAQDVEVAVYFCCLEAIQNVVKHGGGHATATVKLWQDGASLRFVVENPGPGFDPREVHGGRGLVNMRDRIEAVGGTLRVVSAKGRGVSVLGRVPLV